MIRKAERKDAQALAEINYLVMHDFFEARAKNDEEKRMQIDFLVSCIEGESSIFTYKNVFVSVRDGEIAGAIWMYDFTAEKDRLSKMTKTDDISLQQNPLLLFIEGNHDDAREGDMYLDTIAVAKHWQGKGVASELLQFAKEKVDQHGDQPLTLIVDIENPHAQQVYEKHDFEVIEENEVYRSIFRYMRYN